MKEWRSVQRELVEKDLVAEIEVETVTYTRIGGYKATPYGLELGLPSLLTAKSLKGVWRWWARVAVVGARCGIIDYEKADETLSKLLGGAGEREGASLYRLEVTNGDPPTPYQNGELRRLLDTIDKFYGEAKRFMLYFMDVIDKNTKFRDVLKDAKISICVNPFNPHVQIEHKVHRISRLKEDVKNIVKNSSLSSYFVDIKDEKDGKRITIYLKIPDDELNNYVAIPRVRLLLMKRHDMGEDDRLRGGNFDAVDKYIERVKEELSTLITKGWRFKIRLYSNASSNTTVRDDDFALSTLVLSLILGGIGSITRRGFGSLRIISIRIGEMGKVDEQLLSILGRLGIRVEKAGRQRSVGERRALSDKDLKKALDELRNFAIERAKSAFNITCPSGQATVIPLVPSLNRIDIEVIECKSPSLVKIGELFLKQRWKPMPRLSGRDIHTWILGLPRYQRLGGRDTGYVVKGKGEENDPGRRISAIGVRVYSPAEGRNFVVIYGFLSNDWPDKLVHIGSSRSEIDCKSVVKSVYGVAWNKVINLTRGICQQGVNSG